MASFKPPPASLGQCEGVPFDTAIDTAAENKAVFDAFDKTPQARSDPNKCKALLKFPDGTIFWSSKMAIDADGPTAGSNRLSGRQLDPDSGQDDTSFHFPGTRRGLSSEVVPYIVLPHDPNDKKKPFHPNLQLGDVAIVIYKDKLTGAICGDLGPGRKIGEASIRVHEDLHPPAPDPCVRRDQRGFCKLVRNASIERDVLFFVFPGSAFGGELTPKNLEAKVKERAFALFNKLRGVS